jgi:hypothetical protein
MSKANIVCLLFLLLEAVIIIGGCYLLASGKLNLCPFCPVVMCG